MNANFETPARCSATGVTIASILVVMLAMAASILFTPEAVAPTANAAAAATRVAQANNPGPVKKI